MAQSRAFRDTLANTVDVSTLTDWLDVNSAYDAALRRLYQALVDSKGRVTERGPRPRSTPRARPASSCRRTRTGS